MPHDGRSPVVSRADRRGGAFIDAADDELMHVFRTADERLYAAKEAGRNRAVLA